MHRHFKIAPKAPEGLALVSARCAGFSCWIRNGSFRRKGKLPTPHGAHFFWLASTVWRGNFFSNGPSGPTLYYLAQKLGEL